MKLSIITINRNNAEGLRKTMESVLTQTYRDFEYIVVDGASTDNSVGVIKDLLSVSSKNDTNKGECVIDGISIQWLSEPDTGIYNAMNKGIRMANGEYLLFLNSGDFIIKNDAIEKVFDLRMEADIIVARCNVSDKGKVFWTSPYFNNKITLKDLFFIGIPHQSTLIRRSLFEKYGMYREEFRYNSDIDFWYKSIVLGDAIAYGIDIIVADYNLDGLSTKNSQTDLYKKEVEEIFSQGFLPKVIPDYDVWKKERVLLSKYRWIEKHIFLQKILKWYNKICKILDK